LTKANYPEEEFKGTELARPLLEWRGVGYFLDNPAPEQKLLFYGKGWAIPDKCVIAIFAAGATGKTFLCFQLAACLATGINFGPFETTMPLMPPRKKKVLYLCGEDPRDIIHKRMRQIFAHMPGLADRRNDLDANLSINSLVGEDRVMIAFDQQKNPARTQVFDWLCNSIDKMGGVGLIVIDPLSKFFGLNENDNVHGAAWIAMLETISVKYDAAVLFTHHESKQQNKSGDIQTSTGRGAGSFRDNVRGAISMVKMDAATAKKFNYPSNWKKLVAVMPTKSNYSEEAEDLQWFMRGDGGVLFPANVEREQSDKLSTALIDLLRQAVNGQLFDETGSSLTYTRDDLTFRGLTLTPKSPMEKEIRAAMKEEGVVNLEKELSKLLLRLETENKIVIDCSPDGGRSNKQRITVIGCGPPPELEPGVQDKEKQPATADLAEVDSYEKNSSARRIEKPTENRPSTRNKSKKREKNPPAEKESKVKLKKLKLTEVKKELQFMQAARARKKLKLNKLKLSPASAHSTSVYSGISSWLQSQKRN